MKPLRNTDFAILRKLFRERYSWEKPSDPKPAKTTRLNDIDIKKWRKLLIQNDFFETSPRTQRLRL